jgi:hypothetical protein
VLVAGFFVHRWNQADAAGELRPLAGAPPLPEVGRPGSRAEGLELVQVEPEDAVALNARRAFSTAPNPAARAFASPLEGADRARAIGCLAAAALYEAGGTRDYQIAVMQVVLNRVRHPAFPKSVCGVVFQGSERRTGCQFSFTCDGSMQRWRPSAAALENAKALAALMLDKKIDTRVGLATHYHTNWVLPYWSASLDKIAAVDTHLFFRWFGFWGQPRAFHRQPSPIEPIISQLGALEVAHLELAEIELVALAEGEDAITLEVPAPNARAGAMASAADAPRLLVLKPDTGPGRWALDAVAACGRQPSCRLVGWTDPTNVPVAFDAASLAASPPHFAYVQDLRNRVQQAYWNCERWPRLGTARCLSSATATAELLSGS